MRWYADNSELNGIRGSQIPDILLFGGLAVPPDSEFILRTTIEEVKSKFGPPRIPVKWNFKDLKRVFVRQNKRSIYDELLKKSQEWREEIFKAVKDIEFTIIIACVESHSVERRTIISVKEQLTQFVFNNGLMRYALHVKESNPDRAEVILDWPDKGDSSPFDKEYASAFNDGKSPDGVVYSSGALKDLNFLDSAVYTNMNHSTILQFADLLVGATREFVECALGKKCYGFGIDMLKLVFHKFRGTPCDVIGRGISIASKNPQFRSSIDDAIKKYFLA